MMLRCWQHTIYQDECPLVISNVQGISLWRRHGGTRSHCLKAISEVHVYIVQFGDKQHQIRFLRIGEVISLVAQNSGKRTRNL